MQEKLCISKKKGALIIVIKSPTKLLKSGNSSVVRISRDIMEAARIKAGDFINVTFNSHDSSVVIKAAGTDNKTYDCFSKIFDQSLDEDRAILAF